MTARPDSETSTRASSSAADRPAGAPAGRSAARWFRPSRATFAIPVLAFTGLTVSLMQTLIIPVQGELPDLLSASRSATSWVLTITTLVGAVVTPIAGRLGDLYGKRRIMLILLMLTGVGSAVAAVSTGLGPVLVGRALQGTGLGVIPLGIALMRDVLPAEKLGAGVALMSSTLGVGAALGLPLGATVATRFDWHVLFWIGAVLPIVLVPLLAVSVPVRTAFGPRGSFDWFGAILLAVGLTAVLLALSKGAQWGWLSVATLGSGLGGLLALVLLGVFEWRHPDPLIDLRVAARRTVLMTNLASVAMGFALFAGFVAGPQMLQQNPATGIGSGLTMIMASLVMTASGITMMGTSPIAARLIERFDARRVLAVGALVIAVAYGAAALSPLPVWFVLIVNVLTGVGVGLGYAAMPTLIMSSVPVTETAAANGLNTLMRTFGTSMGAAVIGALLAVQTVTHAGHSVPSAAAYHLTFASGCAAALASAVLALCIPRSTQ